MMTIYETHESVLLDLSRTGALIALPEPLAIGDSGYLMVGQFEVFSETVRRMPGHGGGVNGLVFDDPLSHDAVLAVRHHAETFQRLEREALRDQVRSWVTGER